MQGRYSWRPGVIILEFPVRETGINWGLSAPRGFPGVGNNKGHHDKIVLGPPAHHPIPLSSVKPDPSSSGTLISFLADPGCGDGVTAADPHPAGDRNAEKLCMY